MAKTDEIDGTVGTEQVDVIQMLEVIVLPSGMLDTRNTGIFLGKSVKTLAMWRSKGIGPKFQKRGTILYPLSELKHWLADGEVFSTAQARLNKY